MHVCKTYVMMVISLNGFGFIHIHSQNIFLNIILAPLFHVAVELLKIPTCESSSGLTLWGGGGGEGVSVCFSFLTCIFLRMTLITYQNRNLID